MAQENPHRNRSYLHQVSWQASDADAKQSKHVIGAANLYRASLSQRKKYILLAARKSLWRSNPPVAAAVCFVMNVVRRNGGMLHDS